MAIGMDIDRVRNMDPRERAEYDAQVEERVVRFKELRPEWMAYRESALPAHERALYGYVGSVAAENPAGTDAAGWPVEFQSTENGTQPLSHRYVAIAPRPSMI